MQGHACVHLVLLHRRWGRRGTSFTDRMGHGQALLVSAWSLPPETVFVVSAGPATPRARWQSCLQPTPTPSPPLRCDGSLSLSFPLCAALVLSLRYT